MKLIYLGLAWLAGASVLGMIFGAIARHVEREAEWQREFEDWLDEVQWKERDDA